MSRSDWTIAWLPAVAAAAVAIACVLYIARERDELVEARADLALTRQVLADTKATALRCLGDAKKPATPAEQLADFRAHCGEAHIMYDLRKTEPQCENNPGNGVDGPALVCSFKAPYPKEPPAWVVCDKNGCSFSVRNGVGP